MTKQQEEEINLLVIANDINYIKRDVADIKGSISRDYITRQEFEPVKRVVYGLVGLILIAVVGGLLALIIQK